MLQPAATCHSIEPLLAITVEHDTDTDVDCVVAILDLQGNFSRWPRLIGDVLVGVAAVRDAVVVAVASTAGTLRGIRTQVSPKRQTELSYRSPSGELVRIDHRQN